MNEKLGEQILHTQKRQQILQPWTYIIEKATDITLSHPVRTDYAENPEIVLQKTEYAAAKIHPCTYRNSNKYCTQPPCKHRLCRKS